MLIALASSRAQPQNHVPGLWSIRAVFNSAVNPQLQTQGSILRSTEDDLDDQES